MDEMDFGPRPLITDNETMKRFAALLKRNSRAAGKLLYDLLCSLELFPELNAETLGELLDKAVKTEIPQGIMPHLIVPVRTTDSQNIINIDFKLFHVTDNLKYILVRVWSLDEPAAGILYQSGVSAYWYVVGIEASYPLTPEDPVPAQPVDWRLRAMLVVLGILGVIGLLIAVFAL